MPTSAVPVPAMVAQWALLGAVLGALAPALGGLGSPARAAGFVVAVGCAAGGWVLLVRALSRHGRTGLGPADHVTVTRGTLACGVAALTTTSVVAAIIDGTSAGWVGSPLVVLAGVALSLDAVDGWLARRTDSATALGARFDMEVDAFVILVLSVAAGQVLGWWVLSIGLFRYLLVAATWVAPWLGGPVPPTYWRKAVAALQGIALTLGCTEVLPRPVLTGIVAAALVLLAWSFGTQCAELWQARAPRPSNVTGRRVGAAASGAEEGPGPRARVAR